jgi:hypothetical protein
LVLIKIKGVLLVVLRRVLRSTILILIKTHLKEVRFIVKAYIYM